MGNMKKPSNKEQKELGFELMKNSWRVMPLEVESLNEVIQKRCNGVYDFQDLAPEHAAVARKYNLKMYNIQIREDGELIPVFSYNAIDDLQFNYFCTMSYERRGLYGAITPSTKDFKAIKSKIPIQSRWYGKPPVKDTDFLRQYFLTIPTVSDDLPALNHQKIPIPLAVDNSDGTYPSMVAEKYVYFGAGIGTISSWHSADIHEGKLQGKSVDSNTIQQCFQNYKLIDAAVAVAVNHLTFYSSNMKRLRYREYMKNNPAALASYISEMSADRLKVNAKALEAVCLNIGNTTDTLDTLKIGLSTLNASTSDIQTAVLATSNLVCKMQAFLQSLRKVNKKYKDTNILLYGLPGIEKE